MKQFRVLLSAVVCLFMMYSCQDENSFEDLTDDISANHIQRKCSMHDHMEKLMQDPNYKLAHKAKFTRLSSASVITRSSCENPPVIPVAVHYQGVSGDAACLVSLAQNQIQILNNDFQGTNSDIGQWINNASSSFTGVNYSETCLSFCLADKNHPAGYGLIDGEPAVTINQTTGDSNSDFSGYLNIFVQFGTGVLGYAPLGGSGNGDGVVIEAVAFGSGSGCGNVVPGAPYNLGRTTTHEVGHYLLLDHIWGGGCSQDDDVNDTPDSADPYYDCPTVGASSCGSTDMHMNYMDYTNDACMYMFSEGQGDRSENYVATSLSVLTNNAANVCSTTSGDDNPGDDNGGSTDGCGEVDDLAVEIISDTEVKVSWTGFVDAIKYRVRYKPVTGGSYTAFNTTNTTEILSSLQPDVEYKVQVRTQCGDGWSSWSGFVNFILTDNNGGTGSGNDDPVSSNCDAPAIDFNTGEALTNQSCYDQVITEDDYCCGVEFDYLCQEAYDECLNDVSGEDPSGCIIVYDVYTDELLDDDCTDEIQEFDTYCCDIEWDGLCQYYYDLCAENGFNMGQLSQNDNALMTVGEHKTKGIVIISYSSKNWTPDTRIELYDGTKKLKSFKVTKRRGVVEINMNTTGLENLNSKLLVDNALVAQAAK